MQKIIPVVMCTGSGAGLWPTARDTMPKQFIPLFGRESTFQRTLRRLSDPDLFEAPIIVTSPEHRFTVADQLQTIGLRAEIVPEPAERGAHSVAAIAAELGLARNETALVGIFPADHVVQDGRLFVETCARAATAAAQGRIVAIGIAPSHPATAYGYIRPGADIGEGVREVEDVAEKPHAALAARYVADGYLWNSGNVIFDAVTMQAKLRAAAAAAIGNAGTMGANFGIRMLEADGSGGLPTMPAEPAAVERTDPAAVIAGHFGWSDVGDWSAVWQLSEKGKGGNAVQGRGYVLGGSNNLVRSEGAVVAVVGLDDVAVVATRDAVLVTSKAKADKVKEVVALVAANREPEAASHREIHRPWGKYLSVDLDERHQVKRITVKPNGVLSLQKHHHRAEHWVVVRGTAQVTRDDETILVHENEAIYLPIGCVHRMANPGKIPLEIIEVQVGSYLGEDDIIRIEDIYQRC